MKSNSPEPTPTAALIYLFLTGHNLAENSIVLRQILNKYAANYGYKDYVAVKTDDTWEYKWYTSKIALDTRAYTSTQSARL